MRSSRFLGVWWEGLRLAAREKTGEMDPVRPGAKHGTWVDLPDVVVVLEALSQSLSLSALHGEIRV